MNHIPASLSDWVRHLADQYHQPLIRYARRLTGDDATARDVVQDTFLQLCNQDRAQLESHVVRWLYCVCRNRALDVQKKEKRMGSFSASATPGWPAGHEESDPAAQVALADEAQRALHLLGQLPPNQQEVIRLKLEHGLRYQDIADVTGLSVSNVGYLLHVGFKTLRKQLTEART